VADANQAGELFEVDCPHCRRHFRAKLLIAASPQQAGFKCPHCRLFVAFARATDPRPSAG
jgi:phage FluMu protein Com